MSLGLCFWILYLLSLVLGVYWSWPASADNRNFRPFGGNLMLFILVGIIGWSEFGAPLHR